MREVTVRGRANGPSIMRRLWEVKFSINGSRKWLWNFEIAFVGIFESFGLVERERNCLEFHDQLRGMRHEMSSVHFDLNNSGVMSESILTTVPFWSFDCQTLIELWRRNSTIWEYRIDAIIAGWKWHVGNVFSSAKLLICLRNLYNQSRIFARDSPFESSLARTF